MSIFNYDARKSPFRGFSFFGTDRYINNILIKKLIFKMKKKIRLKFIIFQAILLILAAIAIILLWNHVEFYYWLSNTIRTGTVILILMGLWTLLWMVLKVMEIDRLNNKQTK
jgi:hypothetical protein